MQKCTPLVARIFQPRKHSQHVACFYHLWSPLSISLILFSCPCSRGTSWASWLTWPSGREQCSICARCCLDCFHPQPFFIKSLGDSVRKERVRRWSWAISTQPSPNSWHQLALWFHGGEGEWLKFSVVFLCLSLWVIFLCRISRHSLKFF
jgi:hypothetical protein